MDWENDQIMIIIEDDSDEEQRQSSWQTFESQVYKNGITPKNLAN